MQDAEIKDEYDVIVIGAGVGGLTAASLLSKAGLSVCVLEKEPHVGGYLAGFRRKNFIFDTMTGGTPRRAKHDKVRLILKLRQLFK